MSTRTSTALLADAQQKLVDAALAHSRLTEKAVGAFFELGRETLAMQSRLAADLFQHRDAAK